MAVTPFEQLREEKEVPSFEELRQKSEPSAFEKLYDKDTDRFIDEDWELQLLPEDRDPIRPLLKEDEYNVLRKKIVNSLYLADRFQAPAETVFEHEGIFIDMWLDEKDVPPEFGRDRIKQRFQNGRTQVKMMDLGYDVLNQSWRNPEAYEQNLANIQKLQSQMKGDPRKDFRGFWEKIAGATAEQIPIMWEALKEAPVGGSIGMVMGAITAAVSGAVIPGPEEVVTVPEAALLGLKVGAGISAADRIRQLEAGGMFLELMGMTDGFGNKIDPKTAFIVSHSVGAINGAIELVEWQIILSTFGIGKGLFHRSAERVTKKFLAEGTLKHILAKYTLKYGIALGAETLQEIEQETTNIVFGELAKELNNARRGTKFKRISGKDLKARYAEVTAESLRAFGLIVAPGTIISGVFEAQAKKPPVTPTPEAVTPTPEAPTAAPVAEVPAKAVKLPPKAPEAVTEGPKPEVKVEVMPEEGQAAIDVLNTLERFEGVELKVFGSIVGTGRKGVKAKPHDIDIVFDVTSDVYFNHEHPFWEQADALADQDKNEVWIRSPAEVAILQKGEGSPIQRLNTVGGQAAKSIGQAVPIEEAGRIRTENLAKQARPPAAPAVEAWEKSDLATAPNIPVGRTQATKQADGKWKLFFRGTSNEVFQGETFNSAAEAKRFFAVQKLKAQEALAEKPAVEATKIFQDIPKDELDKYIQIAKERGYTNIEVHESTWRTSNIWGEKQALPPAVPVKEAPAAKPIATPEEAAKKLRQKVHAVAAVKGLTKKALSDLKLKHAGYRILTGKIASKKITIEQLESLLKAVQKARPRTVDGKKVLTKKQETKIASLKENLIKLKHLTEADYADILKREARGKEAKYIDSKNFITQAEAANVIKRIHNQAEITRVVEARESAIRKNPEIAQNVDVIDKTINDKRAEMKRDPWQSESMRYYNEQMELKTGAPFYALYLDLTNTHLESTKTRTARLQQLANEVAGFKELSKDEEALQRISLYISSQSRLKTPAPENITDEEVTMAKAIQKIFKEYEAKARWTRFYWWYVTGQQAGPYPIGDYEQYKKEIGKAVDIYEGKGKDEVIEYLKTQVWGVIKSGYEPLENIVQKVRLYKLKPTTVGKSHIAVRTAIEYHKQDRNIIRRLGAYMRQIDMLNDLSPKINAYVQLFQDNQAKFNNPARIKESVETWLQDLKGYNIDGGFWGRIIARLYAQAMRTIIMINPVLAFRNLFQNAAFEHDKSILLDPRNKPLTGEDVEYLETYVQQQRAIIEEYFMLGEKPLPGLKTISRLADHVKLYPASDVANRRWSFWAKISQVRRALTEDTTTEMMKGAKFDDMSDFEQRMALAILAEEGQDAMARFVARTHVADIHFQYERAQRAPVEMGGGLARVYGNLMLFPRAYGEKLTRVGNKMLRGKTVEEQWRAAKTLMAVIGGGMVAGMLYKRITGRRRNPYDPLTVLSWRPGGLAQGTIDAVSTAYSNMILSASGDKMALAAFLNALPGMANMFIPFYDISLRGVEAVTDQKNIDYKFVRQMRAAIDNEYKIRGGAYKLKRNALEKWQYFIGGAGVDRKAEKKPKPVSKLEG